VSISLTGREPSAHRYQDSPSPAENDRWRFNAKITANSIIKKLEKSTTKNLTGESTPRRVILDAVTQKKKLKN